TIPPMSSPAGRWATPGLWAAIWDVCGRRGRTGRRRQNPSREGPEHRQGPIAHPEGRGVDLGSDLAVVGQHGGAVDGAERELRHPHLVVERAAVQTAEQ